MSVPGVCENLNEITENQGNKRMLCATRKRKRAADNIQKYDKINEILSEFDCFSPDQQISSLSATLERLGSL